MREVVRSGRGRPGRSDRRRSASALREVHATLLGCSPEGERFRPAAYSHKHTAPIEHAAVLANISGRGTSRVAVAPSDQEAKTEKRPMTKSYQVPACQARIDSATCRAACAATPGPHPRTDLRYRFARSVKDRLFDPSRICPNSNASVAEFGAQRGGHCYTGAAGGSALSAGNSRSAVPHRICCFCSDVRRSDSTMSTTAGGMR